MCKKCFFVHFFAHFLFYIFFKHFFLSFLSNFLIKKCNLYKVNRQDFRFHFLVKKFHVFCSSRKNSCIFLCFFVFFKFTFYFLTFFMHFFRQKLQKRCAVFAEKHVLKTKNLQFSRFLAKIASKMTKRCAVFAKICTQKCTKNYVDKKCTKNVQKCANKIFM